MRVGGEHQLAAGRHAQQRRVIADAQEHVARALPPGARKKRSISCGFGQAHRTAQPVSSARHRRAARSSTPLTNLWPSVAPKRRASPTASLMTTRNGTSLRCLQLVAADQQCGMLDRIELGGLAIQQRRQRLIERLVRGADALDQSAKVIRIGVQRLSASAANS